jgi:hypothetical protein
VAGSDFARRPVEPKDAIEIGLRRRQKFVFRGLCGGGCAWPQAGGERKTNRHAFAPV